MHTLDLTVSEISKIEGKASCSIKVRNSTVESVKFAIAEYKRFYTQAIRGKDVVALPQLTARICGTCSNAHLLCAIKACERALGIIPSEQTRLLRRLLNFGLYIRDHALHLYVFVLPDLFNKDSILDFNEQDPVEHKYLDDTFSVKAAGNNLGKIVGGRSVHAPFVMVGGFIKMPQESLLKKSLAELKNVRPLVIDLIELFAKRDATLEINNLEFAAILDEDYSFQDGDLVMSSGERLPSEMYGTYLKRVPVPYSYASAYSFKDKIYMVGALARLNLGKECLHEQTKKDVKDYLSLFPSKNIFHNNLAQAIEILHAIDSSIDILSKITIREEKPATITRKTGRGIGLTEAPRGILYYNLELTSEGKIKTGQIVVPTGANQRSIEDAIRKFLEKNIKTLKDKETIEHEIEKIVRAYDPCMSCASHFLKFRWV